MIDIPKTLCEVALVCAVIWGIHVAFERGYIFGFLGDYLANKLPSYITKPLFACPVCMASVWGVIFHSLYLWVNQQSGVVDTSTPIIIFATAGVNYVIISALNK